VLFTGSGSLYMFVLLLAPAWLRRFRNPARTD
jgi:hypothetical protein